MGVGDDHAPDAAPMRYFPVREKWRRIRPHLANPGLQRVLARDLAKFGCANSVLG